VGYRYNLATYNYCNTCCLNLLWKVISKKIWFFSFIVLSGVLMVNMSYVEMSDIKELLMGGFPVLIAAFCYPTGNQLVWEAKNGNKYLPNIENPLLENPFNKVLLLSLGSVPFWLLLVVINTPPTSI